MYQVYNKVIHICVCVLVAQLCPTLCDPMDYSLPGSSVHGILQARILEWVAIPFSRESPHTGIKPISLILWAKSLLSEPPGKPDTYICMYVFRSFSIIGHYKISNI